MGTVETWMFTAKDVIWIITMVASGLSVYYAAKQEINSLKLTLEKMQEEIDGLEEDVNKKETIIYDRMEQIKDEQKKAHEKLDLKMDNLTSHMTTLSNNIAELTGYIKAKEEKKG